MQTETNAAEVMSYLVEVDYRTQSGGNTTTVKVYAANIDDAFSLASTKVAKRRGVMKVDGGTLLGSPLPVTAGEQRQARRDRTTLATI